MSSKIVNGTQTEHMSADAYLDNLLSGSISESGKGAAVGAAVGFLGTGGNIIGAIGGGIVGHHLTKDKSTDEEATLAKSKKLAAKKKSGDGLPKSPKHIIGVDDSHLNNYGRTPQVKKGKKMQESRLRNALVQQQNDVGELIDPSNLIVQYDACRDCWFVPGMENTITPSVQRETVQGGLNSWIQQAGKKQPMTGKEDDHKDWKSAPAPHTIDGPGVYGFTGMDMQPPKLAGYRESVISRSTPLFQSFTGFTNDPLNYPGRLNEGRPIKSDMEKAKDAIDEEEYGSENSEEAGETSEEEDAEDSEDGDEEDSKPGKGKKPPWLNKSAKKESQLEESLNAYMRMSGGLPYTGDDDELWRYQARKKQQEHANAANSALRLAGAPTVFNPLLQQIPAGQMINPTQVGWMNVHMARNR